MNIHKTQQSVLLIESMLWDFKIIRNLGFGSLGNVCPDRKFFLPWSKGIVHTQANHGQRKKKLSQDPSRKLVLKMDLRVSESLAIADMLILRYIRITCCGTQSGSIAKT